MENYKLHAIKKEQWLKAYQKSGSFTEACRSVNISRNAVYNLIKADKDFKDKKEEIENLINEVVENRLLTMTKRNPTACFFWLCNRMPERWKNLNKTEHHISKEFEEALDKIAQIIK